MSRSPPLARRTNDCWWDKPSAQLTKQTIKVYLLCLLAITGCHSVCYIEPLANLFDLSLSKCPSGEIPVDPIAVEWDLNGQKQPGPIDPKSIILEYRPEDEKKPAVLSCADARFHNASCMPPADGLRWCRWMVSKEKAHCNVTGLTAYTFYTFKLTAGNSKGNAMKQVQNRTCLDREYTCCIVSCN